MPKTYRTALGQAIDFDAIRAQNDTAIAVGNMKTNARGDELGPGGKILRTRDQVMKDLYSLKTPVAADENLSVAIQEQQRTANIPQSQGRIAADPIPQDEPVVVPEDSGIDDDDMGEATDEQVATETTDQPLRSSFASSVAKQATVTQKPLPNPKKARGVKRF